MKGKCVIFDCRLAKKHVPAIYNDQLFCRHPGFSHVFAELGNPPKALKFANRPIHIDQVIRNLVDALVQFVKNVFLNVLNRGVDVTVFLVEFRSD